MRHRSIVLMTYDLIDRELSFLYAKHDFSGLSDNEIEKVKILQKRWNFKSEKYDK